MTNFLTQLQPNPRFEHLINPSKEWFEVKPDWWGKIANNKLWVDDDGRVAGLVCNWDQCIIDGSEECWSPERLPDNYDFAYQNSVTYDDGTVDNVAVLAATDGHGVFENPQASLEFNQGKRGKDGKLLNTMDSFANRVMSVKFHNTDEGLIMLGSIYPHVSEYMFELVRNSAVSGHWQHIPESGEPLSFLGAVFVNKPGLPLRKVAGAICYNGDNIILEERHSMGDVVKVECGCEKIAATETIIEDGMVETDDMVETYSKSEVDDMFSVFGERLTVLEDAVSSLLQDNLG